MNSRNIEVNGTLINIYFFCRAVGLKKPLGLQDPIGFMERYVEENHLDWFSISEKVKEHRAEYKQRRRASQQRRALEQKREEEEFFKQFNPVKPKYRDCLKCDERFYSPTGNRLCEKCHHSNSGHIEEFGI